MDGGGGECLHGGFVTMVSEQISLLCNKQKNETKLDLVTKFCKRKK